MCGTSHDGLLLLWLSCWVVFIARHRTTDRRTDGGWKFEEFVKDVAVSNVVIAVPYLLSTGWICGLHN